MAPKPGWYPQRGAGPLQGADELPSPGTRCPQGWHMPPPLLQPHSIAWEHHGGLRAGAVSPPSPPGRDTGGLLLTAACSRAPLGIRHPHPRADNLLQASVPRRGWQRREHKAGQPPTSKGAAEGAGTPRCAGKPQPSLRAPRVPSSPLQHWPGCASTSPRASPRRCPFSSPAPTLACPAANFGKDISGMFLLDSHFLRINGLIDADGLQERSAGG